jgi:flagellar basal-body rod protein FlgB
MHGASQSFFAKISYNESTGFAIRVFATLSGNKLFCENIWTAASQYDIETHLSQELRRTMLEGISLFRIAASRMQYLAERQSVIARNIANADTPNYIARDLKPFGSLLTGQTSGASAQAGLPLAQTSSGHLAGTSFAPATSSTSTSVGDGEKPNGNRVSLEEQMVKSADNANSFALVSAAYAKTISIMKMSIDK